MRSTKPEHEFDFRISQVGEYCTADKPDQGFLDELNTIVYRVIKWGTNDLTTSLVKAAEPKSAPPVFFPETGCKDPAHEEFVMYIRPVINNLGTPNLQNFSLKVDTVTNDMKELNSLEEINAKKGHELIKERLVS